MGQVSMDKAARAAARMAAVAALCEALRGQAELLILEARDAEAHALAVKGGAVLRGSAGLSRMIEEGTELAAEALTKAALSELEVAQQPTRLMVSDLPRDMRA